jgi:hypothetical protein
LKLTLEAQLVQTLYDSATPAIASTTGNSMSVLNTNISTWTLLRTILFWVQVALRIGFVLEVGLRIATKSLARFLRNPIDIVDACVCFAALILKFSLSARESLAFNLIIILRLMRIATLIQISRADLEEIYSQKSALLERHCDEMIKISKLETENLAAKLKVAENKFKIMIGEVQV